MTMYVQFTDVTQTAIGAVFSCAQDPEIYLHQGEVEDDDPRYVAYIGGELPPTLERLKADLTEAATAQRWAVETGGTTLPDGTQVLTGSGDQARLTSVLANAANAEITHVDFKSTGLNGQVLWERNVPVDFVKQVARVVSLHVQACFTAECEHHLAIANLATLAEAQAYDVMTGWPA